MRFKTLASGLMAAIVLSVVLWGPSLTWAQEAAKTRLAEDASLAPQAKEAFDAAYALGRKGHYDEALARYEEAVRLAPQHAGIWTEYGLCLRNTYHLQRAVQATWRAMELAGPSAGLWANLGNIYLNAQAWEAAEGAYEKAAGLAEDPRWSAQNFLNLGYQQWLSGQNDGAIKAFQRALVADPNSGLALVDLACVHASQEKTQEALQETEQATPLLQAAGDQSGLQYARKVQKAIKKDRRFKPPEGFVAFEKLPQRFLDRPPEGQALSVATDPAVTRFYRVPRIGVLSITVKEAWKTHLDTKVVPGATTIVFAPPQGDDFQFLWTPLQPPGRPAGKLKSMLKAIGTRQLSQAVEKELQINEIQSPSMQGYYYLLTDRSMVGKPSTKPGEYPYMICCMLKAGNADSTLTILCRRNEEGFVKEMVDAIATITPYTPPEQATTATAATRP